MTRGRAALMVLGCAKNQVEAESLSARLALEGWTLTADVPTADVVIVHSCGFLESARREARDTLALARRAAPRSRVVLTGCFAQFLNGRRIPEADALLGTGQLHLLPGVLESFKGQAPGAGLSRSSPAGYHGTDARPLRVGQRSAYVRVGEGCDHRCSFCLIPQLRGPLHSRPMADVLAEADDLIARGIRELVLISQDTTAYGRDRGEASLADLLTRLAERKHLRWIRVLYAHPSEVDDRLIDLLAHEPKLLGYLDMPLQHMADPVLKAMGRSLGERPTRDLLDRLVQRVPRLALRTTFMVGFPGETEGDFRVMEDMVRSGVFEHVGVFPYSRETRSPSARRSDPVALEVVQERWQRLLNAHRAAKARRDRARLGQRTTVLVEKAPDGTWSARAPHQAPEVDGMVRLDRMPARTGFCRVTVTGVRGIDLTAALRPAGRPGDAP